MARLAHRVPANAHWCPLVVQAIVRTKAALPELLVALADELWKGVRVRSLEEAVIDAIAVRTGRSRWDVFSPSSTAADRTQWALSPHREGHPGGGQEQVGGEGHVGDGRGHRAAGVERVSARARSGCRGAHRGAGTDALTRRDATKAALRSRTASPVLATEEPKCPLRHTPPRRRSGTRGVPAGLGVHVALP